MKHKLIIFTQALLLSITLFGCQNPYGKTDHITADAAEPAQWEWPVSSMEDQGVDPGLIGQLEQYITDNHIKINSFLLVRNGFLIEEKYFTAGAESARRPIYSCTKSVLSALLGIAIHEGYFLGAEDRITDLLEMGQNEKDKFSEITLRNLLHMNAGLGAIDSYQIGRMANAIDDILEMSLVHKPGEVFLYTCAGPHLISAAIQKMTGVKTSDYADNKLLEPLGIQDAPWQMDMQGVSIGGAGLQLTPEEMARFGLLYLNNGVWEDEQIVSAEWIEESLSNLVDAPGTHPAESAGYGYLWWMNGFGGYSARGYGAQYIFVIPDENLVAVFTSDLYDNGFFIPYDLMEHYVLPALS